MTGPGGSVKRSVAHEAAAVVMFVGTAIALHEPAPPAAPDQPIREVSFAIFDGEAFRPNQNVWVEDGRIQSVGKARSPDGYGPCRRPGADTGAGPDRPPRPHLWHQPERGAPLRGDVAARSVHRLGRRRVEAAARNALARWNEADLFSAGMLATAAGGHGTQFGVPVETLSAPSEAGAGVQARKAEGSDWIKIVYEDGCSFGIEITSLDDDTIGALIAAAHAEGMLAVVHVSTIEHALEVVDLGADGQVHVWGDTVIDEAQAARIAEAGVFVAPTLSVLAAISGNGIDSELLEAAGKASVSRMQRKTLACHFTNPDGAGDRAGAAGQAAIENMRHLHAAGVRLITGTDAPNPSTGSGISLHGALRLLMRGHGSAKVLVAAMSTPAAIFGLNDRGHIEAGQLADLVLADADLERNLSLNTGFVAIWRDAYRLNRSLDEEAPAPPPAPEATLISGIDDGDRAGFGAGWQVTTDQMRGGSSTASLSARQGALRVERDVATRHAAFVFARSGVIYFPIPQPMQPVDFPGRELLRFRPRGDARDYLVMLFGSGAAGVPPSVPFTAPADWTEVEIPLARFPTVSPGLIGGLAFVAMAPTDNYAFELDDVEVR